MRADDFLNEGGLRSWLWKLGKDAFDYAAGQAPRVKNTVDQPKGGVFGGRVPGSPDDVSHVYRNMSPEELEAARKSGYFEKNPNPGRTTWDTDKKYWSQGDAEGYFGRAWKDTPDNAQVRLPQEKLPRWTAGRTGDAEVFDKNTGTWGPVKEDNPDYDEDRYLKSDPGTPLSFPKGTTLVDVSDVYDWYKLGMAVSDLDDADPRTFNKGVPHTVFAFGSEEEEHKMIPLLKRLGFSLHDIDTPEDYEKAIRADEAIAYLEEMAGEIHGGIRKALMAKGYKYLGGGIDKQAYLEPNGQVYIVFGYRKGVDDFSPDQRMFINWINYCNRHQDNPHLPRFSAFESFKFQGKNYIQARMETLQELPKTVGTLVGQIDQVTKQIGRGNFKSAYEKIKSYAEFASAEDYYAPDYNPQYFEDVQEVVNLLGGPQQADGLLKTVYEVSRFARKHNFTVDLHSGNYMQRPDGTIVVNDPFVIWERNL